MSGDKYPMNELANIEMTEESKTLMTDLNVFVKECKEPLGRPHGTSPAAPDVTGAVVS